MPRRDGTGPLGYGARSGKGMGFCRTGFGYGQAGGRGYGHRVNSPALLAARKRMLEQELKTVETLLGERPQA